MKSLYSKNVFVGDKYPSLNSSENKTNKSHNHYEMNMNYINAEPLINKLSIDDNEISFDSDDVTFISDKDKKAIGKSKFSLKFLRKNKIIIIC